MADPVRILYLDDDAGLGVLLNRALARHGYDVVSVQTGEEALAALGQEPFHVLAMDHNLTNEVGLDVIPKVQALPGAPPIIYVTGSEDVRIAVAALKAGAVDYVWKDVQGHYRELLRQAIDTALEQEKNKREREIAQQQVVEARDRAEALLKEVNHRVANSLAIASALVKMQANVAKDPTAKEMLLETQARINAIGGVHKRLYTSSDVRTVELNVYLQSLLDDLAMSLEMDRGHMKFIPADEEVSISTDRAVSLGVIVTELVTNASKYAYAGKTDGQIRLRLTRTGANSLDVAVEDDGVGWSGTGDIKGTGLGGRIIKAMSQSLQTDLRYDNPGSGTRAVLSIET